MNAENDLISGV